MITATPDRTLVLTSYPPRVCGIATYSQDLVTALNLTFTGPDRYTICALEDDFAARDYPHEVTHSLNTMDADDHVRLAVEIDQDARIKSLWVQHEFGLFNGGQGHFLLELLTAVQKPIAITFHTVLPAPAADRRSMIRALAQQAADIIVLTERSASILRTEYAIPTEKITAIAHGTHPVKWRNKQQMKEKHGLQDRQVLSTFGLLSSNKGIETALEALVAIKERVPNVLYLVLGRTHPEVLRKEGEQYRESLMRKVEELALQDHVRFVDHYLALDELLEHLQFTDVYLFTSQDPEQAVSGTFAYALGCGCPVISTRIPHAAELLDEGTGILIDFNSPSQLAQAAAELLLDPDRMERMARNALHRMRPTAWDNVAIAHARTFGRRTGSTDLLRFRWPEVSLQQLHRMTTDVGIVQFCDISEPDLTSGHTLDDNARALIAVCNHASNVGTSGHDNGLAARYLRYMLHCQQADGRFLNYADAHGAFTEQNHGENLDDSNGRALWALGVCVAQENALPYGMVRSAEHALWSCFPWVADLTSPRAIAFSIKGLQAYNSLRRSKQVATLIDRLAERLLSTYKATATAEWNWFEPILTYGNAVLPEALLLAHLETKRMAYREAAAVSFEFLLGCLFKGDMLRIISNRSWMKPGADPDPFGEQPIDAAYTISALALFAEVFGNPEHRRMMHIAFEWFLGRNHLAQVMYNRASGGCYDGLEEHSVNLNQGAESTVCYLLARTAMERSWSMSEARRPLNLAIVPRSLALLPPSMRTASRGPGHELPR
jgi:glycosyltransferase involved in cell wall biosynthesis